MKETPLIHRDKNLIYKEHDCKFGVDVHDLSKGFGGKKYINSGYQVISMNFG